MPNRPFQPLFGKRANTEKLTEKAVLKQPSAPLPISQDSTPEPLVVEASTQPELPLKSLKQKALSSLGELAFFVDKRKNIFIIVIIILILIAVVVVAHRQEQQRKKLKLMRRKLRKLMK